jgi:hypothetical protein
MRSHAEGNGNSRCLLWPPQCRRLKVADWQIKANMTDNNLFRWCSSLADTKCPAIYPKVMGRAFPIFD